MKEYLNLFHSIVSEIHFWNELDNKDKKKKISIYFENYENIDYLFEYFDTFNADLSKMTLNSYIKSVSND